MDELRISRISITAVALALVVSGCTQSKQWLGDHGMPGFDETPPVEVVTVTTDTIIAELGDLIHGDAALQALIYNNAKAAAKENPLPAVKLRYALIVATPGHVEFDPKDARKALENILAVPSALTAAEANLATAYLAEINNLIELKSDLRALHKSQLAERDEAYAKVTTRLTKTEEENARLKKLLREAEQKLEAITSIERSMRERTDKEPQ